jgi:hypothetical protein
LAKGFLNMIRVYRGTRRALPEIVPGFVEVRWW